MTDREKLGFASAAPLAVDWFHGDDNASGGLADGEYTIHADYATSLGRHARARASAVHAGARPRDHRSPATGPTTRSSSARSCSVRDLAPLDGRPGKWIVPDPTDGTAFHVAPTTWTIKR